MSHDTPEPLNHGAMGPEPGFDPNHHVHYQHDAGQQSFSGSEFLSGAALGWEWDNSIGLADFAGFYEPQGELVNEVPTQRAPTGDFNMPEPIVQHHIGREHSHLEAQAPTFSLTQTPPLQSPMPTTRPMQSPARVELGSKRKAPESEPASATSAARSNSFDVRAPPSKRQTVTKPRSDSNAAAPSAAPAAAVRKPPSRTQSAESDASPDQGERGDGAAKERDKGEKDTQKGASQPTKKPSTTGKAKKAIPSPKEKSGTLPAGKVFPIQIGSELFRLSGASISSDSPSYFSQYFGDQLKFAGSAGSINTLYIDRDPVTFREIALHLQGYYIVPRDATHFIKLFADSQFYSLPRLTQQLFKNEIFIKIGQKQFQLPRQLFTSPGDDPNYFTLGFGHFLSTPTDSFPGLDKRSLLRPPPILPPTIPHHSGEIFTELLQLLQGYEVRIRDEKHRADLLRDARYYHFKGLEQRLLPVDIRYNAEQDRKEITVRLEDIRPSGVTYSADDPATTQSVIVTHPSTASTPDPTSLRPPSTAEAATTAADTAGSNTTSVTEVSKVTSTSPDAPAATETPPSATSVTAPAIPSTSAAISGHLKYARPYVDETAYELIVETSEESGRLDLNSMRVDFSGTTRARVASLLQLVATKLNLPASVPLGLMLLRTGGGVAAQPVSPANSGLSGDTVRVRIDRDAWVELDGKVLEWEPALLASEHDDSTSPAAIPPSLTVEADPSSPNVTTVCSSPAASRRMTHDLLRASSGSASWIIRRAHWRVRVERAERAVRAGGAGLEVVLCAVRIEAFTGERARNGTRAFLTAADSSP